MEEIDDAQKASQRLMQVEHTREWWGWRCPRGPGPASAAPPATYSVIFCLRERGQKSGFFWGISRFQEILKCWQGIKSFQ